MSDNFNDSNFGHQCNTFIKELFFFWLSVNLFSDSSPYYGRVGIFVNDSWMGICNAGFGSTETNVLCRELGFVSGTKQKYPPKGFVSENIPVNINTHVKNLQCTGTEASLLECKLEFGQCPMEKFVSVLCVETENSDLCKYSIMLILKCNVSLFFFLFLISNL